MITTGVIFLGLIALALFTIWNQNNRIKVLEFELRALQKAFMAMRDRLGGDAAAPAGTGTGDVSANAAGGPDGIPVAAAAPGNGSADGETPGIATGSSGADEDGSASPQPGTMAASVAHETSPKDGQATATARKPGQKPDLESALGGRWAVWVGGLALALGGLFLVRYTIEAGLLGPKTRLTLAAMLGILAAGGGEWLRRSGLKLPIAGLAGAYLPGILTAAGAFILFGTVYAAHGYYGFIGPAFAFVLLGLISVASIALALLHGQAFGGLGLIGSLATPALVSSDAPNPWALFGFLAIVLAATAFIARIGRWWPMMSAAIAGTGLWCLAYLYSVSEIAVAPVVFAAIMPVAALTAVWLRPEDDDRPLALDVLPATLATAVLGGLEIAGLSVHGGMNDPVLIGIVAIIAALVAGPVWRRAALPLAIGAGLAAIFWQLWAQFGALYAIIEFEGVIIESDPAGPPTLMMPASWLVLVLFLAAGIWQARRLQDAARHTAACWALFAAAVPLLTISLMWLTLGNINIDIVYAFLLLALAAILTAGAELLNRKLPPQHPGSPALWVLASGGFASLIVAIHAGTGPGMTSVLCGVAITLPALALRLRPWKVLPPLSVATSLFVLGRIAYEPSIVGEEFLGATPVFNWLLPGYGVPALGAIFAAWQIRTLADGRMRHVMEALSALFVLLTAAILVRHAMNDGELYRDALSLAEQAIYTLIAIGGGAILVALDSRSPSPVFRIGSMIIGGLSMVFIVTSHFVALNPLVTNESTGKITFFNLLLLAYLMPGAAMAALALYARPKRPQPYVACLGLTSAALAFAYVSLSIRRLYWGEYIGSWKGLTGWENYTYSAAWLAIGVAILVIGIRLRSTTLRLASAVLIVISVAKVFLFDMSQLEGVLRALSFIGLGVVLIGIGVFYQRMIASSSTARETVGEPAPEV